jgi:hypothetical protein
MIAPAAQSSKVQVQRGRNVRIQTRVRGQDASRPAQVPYRRAHVEPRRYDPAGASMALRVIEITPASDPDDRSVLVVVNSPEPTDY